YGQRDSVRNGRQLISLRFPMLAGRLCRQPPSPGCDTVYNRHSWFGVVFDTAKGYHSGLIPTDSGLLIGRWF
ncbi:MAG: hypothetical protein QF565_12305, partial [Arenicellales bacterium]|nr:hypothetical protein [Arenicellales bacterium]